MCRSVFGMNSAFRVAVIIGLTSVCVFAGPAEVAGTPRIPFGFVENRGQAAPSILYIGMGADLKACFDSTGLLVQHGAASVRVEFAASSRNPVIEPLDETGASVNYLRGNDPSRWRTGVPLFGALRYRDVWPGIDILYRGDSGHLTAEYIIAPGADLSRIRLRFDGKANIADDESLTVHNHSGEITEAAPILYQTDSTGERNVVAGNFKLLDASTVGFDAAYDHSKPLVIDPPILFSGYFGGAAQQQITAVAVTWTNQIVVAGWTSSTNLPASNGARTTSGGGVDAFIAAFSPVGGQLIYCTYLGGSGDDRAFGVAVDRSSTPTSPAGLRPPIFPSPVAPNARSGVRGMRLLRSSIHRAMRLFTAPMQAARASIPARPLLSIPPITP